MRLPVAALAAWVAAIGLWQIGNGLYIPAKALVAQVMLNEAWRRTLSGTSQAKPWPWADTWPVARLRVPKHGIDQIVLAGTSGRTIAFGPGHLDGTPLPGASGNSIIGGHRDTSLAFLEHVAVGDRLTIDSADGARVSYRVTGHRVFDARHPWPSPDVAEKRLTLVTCYPFDAVVPGGPLRYLVFAEAVPD